MLHCSPKSPYRVAASMEEKVPQVLFFFFFLLYPVLPVEANFLTSLVKNFLPGFGPLMPFGVW